MLILGAVGLQIRLSDCSTFRSTSGRLQSKNVPLDLRSLAKQECSMFNVQSSIFFPAKIQQTERANLTFRSFRFFSFDKS